MRGVQDFLHSIVCMLVHNMFFKPVNIRKKQVMQKREQYSLRKFTSCHHIWQLILLP